MQSKKLQEKHRPSFFQIIDIFCGFLTLCFHFFLIQRSLRTCCLKQVNKYVTSKQKKSFIRYVYIAIQPVAMVCDGYTNFMTKHDVLIFHFQLVIHIRWQDISAIIFSSCHSYGFMGTLSSCIVYAYYILRIYQSSSETHYLSYILIEMQMFPRLFDVDCSKVSLDCTRNYVYQQLHILNETEFLWKQNKIKLK